MSIRYQVLGKPGRDNALMVWIDSGTQIHRLLFDCGENLLHEVKQAEIKAIDYLFFSHFHIDHVAGFDYFFRRNYDRDSKPICVWGPEDTSRIIQNRLQGFKWNLAGSQPGIWEITEITEDGVHTDVYKTSEGFSKRHRISESKFTGTIMDNSEFSVQCAILNHIIPTIAYSITEKNSLNIDKAALAESGYAPGPWLEKLKDLTLSSDEILTIGMEEHTLGELRERLLIETQGESISYLTDFINDDLSRQRAAALIKMCGTVVCESQYSVKDAGLAERNYHMTTQQTAAIAKAAGAKKLILFHISERYTTNHDYPDLLAEAREVFPETYFPEEWGRFHGIKSHGPIL